MSVKVVERGTNRKLVYELHKRRIAHRFRDTSSSNAENHILLTPLVFDLAFEGNAVGIVETKFGSRKLE